MDCQSCHQSCQTKRQHLSWNWLKFWTAISKRRTIKIPGVEGLATAKLPTVTARSLESFKTIAVVGSPNVGKSSIFNLLTGANATVSNYPGTTVEVSRSTLKIAEETVTIIDTPGLYSLIPITEEERVARDLLFSEPIDLLVHVIDAKQLGRMLALTLQLQELGIPLLVVINMIDEAKTLGIQINSEKLAAALNLPVVTMAAALEVGLEELITRITRYVKPTPVSCCP